MFKNKHLEIHMLFYFADMHALNAQTLKHVQIAFSCFNICEFNAAASLGGIQSKNICIGLH